MNRQGLKPRQQGDLGEAAAIAWLMKAGAGVSVPLFHSPDYDLIAEIEARLLRVQVKTCRRRRGGRYQIQLSTSGGNQSWNRVTKLFDSWRCDALFVLVADGRRWFIPSRAVDGRRGILLGGAKYSEFEVDPEAAVAFAFGPALESVGSTRGSAGVGEPGRTVNSVAKPEGVRIPPPPFADATSKSPADVPVRRSPIGRTRISSGHQITIPTGPFRHAGLAAGTRLCVEAIGSGTVVLTRIDEDSAEALTADAAIVAGNDGAASSPAARASRA
jgi:bifunctional DNA-binding transcriptional regulator/antitoxin component of YhaV-PrlF toxin-antitoxin module